ncbi:hypothetical protein ECARS42123_5184 [Escherichia coli ARS4.2123]|nr:hypothetical protein ECARS42123_5184 [Escherichia coli ARS4.2123]
MADFCLRLTGCRLISPHSRISRRASHRPVSTPLWHNI